MRKIICYVIIFIVMWSLIFGFDLKFGYDKNENQIYVNYKVNTKFKIKQNRGV